MNVSSNAALHGSRLNVIWTLIWQYFVPANPREGVKLFWVFAEPAGQLLVLLLLFTLIGRVGGYGISFPLFLLTGIAILHIFRSASQEVMSAILQSSRGKILPGAGLFDRAIAALVFRLIVGLVSTVGIAIFVIHWQNLWGVPYDVIVCVEALMALMALAFGVGLLRACSRLFFPAPDRIYSIFSRLLLFVSGVFYVPAYLPPPVRDILVWNPILHGIEWLRTGVYSSYPQLLLSRSYVLSMAIVFIALGMAILWHKRHRILT